ncbi:MAG: ATP-binding cassette domain-containing protein [Clostridiales bacterium]|nr:ATP-binding cassette domain-containing protein [Clostridiales bacterium]
MRKMANEASVLEVRHVFKDYRIAGEKTLFSQTFHAVEDISLEIRQGETFGVVGESGCGKSTLARLMVCLEKPTSGEVYFQGTRVDQMPEGQLRRLRPKFQMVFQDSGSSLNPRKRVQDILREPMLYHGIGKRTQIDQRVDEFLEMVGLPVEMKDRYPHAFSGGQRQRICIARALSLNPEVIVLDEPVSALDVSVQAQILNLLRELQKKLGLTYVFIGHGLGAVHYVSHRIAVMYLGRIVEYGTSDDIFDHPAHPYSKALLDAAPVADLHARDRVRSSLKGEMDETPPSGACPLFNRCPNAQPACRTFENIMREVSPGHFAVCDRAREE